MARPGTFKPGQTGNPAGRPKVAEEFRAKCRKAVDELVISAWIAEVEDMGSNWMKASELLAAYGYGKPAQPVTGENGEGAVPLSVNVTFVGPGDKNAA